MPRVIAVRLPIATTGKLLFDRLSLASCDYGFESMSGKRPKRQGRAQPRHLFFANTF